MTFEETLPAVIVLGYGLMAVLLRARSKVNAKLPKEAGEPPTGETPVPPAPAGAQRVRLPPAEPAPVAPLGELAALRTRVRVLTWAAVLAGVGTTVTWLVAALDLSGILWLFGGLLGLVVVVLLLGVALQSETATRKVFGTLGVLALVADLWFLILTPALYLLGLTRDISIRVTEVVVSSSNRSPADTTTVRGTYELDGATQHADVLWLAWGPDPAAGEVVSAGVFPGWPRQIFADDTEAWVFLGMGLFLPVFFGLIIFGRAGAVRRVRGRRSARAGNQESGPRVQPRNE